MDGISSMALELTMAFDFFISHPNAALVKTAETLPGTRSYRGHSPTSSLRCASTVTKVFALQFLPRSISVRSSEYSPAE
ncbi:hypothetical protein PISMIDRAFT_684415 [Pisolithus microcarpus 441]|uniref:Uncharacterized protein n=1 Tax=Pisolithus microcarpus 441 TaxID=765257 RepID=A0A0C9Y0F5_9AGAM|nr:hypothetical protein PISMIDRAFT_684415 [Pisolithus microcarpus 441]